MRKDKGGKEARGDGVERIFSTRGFRRECMHKSRKTTMGERERKSAACRSRETKKKNEKRKKINARLSREVESEGVCISFCWKLGWRRKGKRERDEKNVPRIHTYIT